MEWRVERGTENGNGLGNIPLAAHYKWLCVCECCEGGGLWKPLLILKIHALPVLNAVFFSGFLKVVFHYCSATAGEGSKALRWHLPANIQRTNSAQSRSSVSLLWIEYFLSQRYVIPKTFADRAVCLPVLFEQQMSKKKERKKNSRQWLIKHSHIYAPLSRQVSVLLLTFPFPISSIQILSWWNKDNTHRAHTPIHLHTHTCR